MSELEKQIEEMVACTRLLDTDTGMTIQLRKDIKELVATQVRAALEKCKMEEQEFDYELDGKPLKFPRLEGYNNAVRKHSQRIDEVAARYGGERVFETEPVTFDPEDSEYKRLICPKCKDQSEPLKTFSGGKKCDKCGTYYIEHISPDGREEKLDD